MTEPDTTAAARLFGLSKRFRGFRLGPLDVALEPGTVLALIGPNGAGKTTTLNCMAGLLVPDEGGTEVFGAPVHPARTEYRRDVGYVGEESGFFPTLERRPQPGLPRPAAARMVPRPGAPARRAFRPAPRQGGEGPLPRRHSTNPTSW